MVTLSQPLLVNDWYVISTLWIHCLCKQQGNTSVCTFYRNGRSRCPLLIHIKWRSRLRANQLESSSVATSGNSFKRVQIKTDPASCTAYFSPEMSSETHFQQVSKLAAMLVQFETRRQPTSDVHPIKWIECSQNVCTTIVRCWSSTQCWLGSWASAFGHVPWAFYGCFFHPQSWYYHQIPINLFICNRCYLDCATTFPNSLKYFETCSRHWIQNKHILKKNNTCGT